MDSIITYCASLGGYIKCYHINNIFFSPKSAFVNCLTLNFNITRFHPYILYSWKQFEFMATSVQNSLKQEKCVKNRFDSIKNHLAALNKKSLRWENVE